MVFASSYVKAQHAFEPIMTWPAASGLCISACNFNWTFI